MPGLTLFPRSREDSTPGLPPGGTKTIVTNMQYRERIYGIPSLGATYLCNTAYKQALTKLHTYNLANQEKG